MQDQLVLAIATVLASKGAEALAAGGKSALDALIRLVRTRFADRDDRAAALEAAMSQPDESRRDELAAALAATMAEDPAFDVELRSRWRAISAGAHAKRDGVVNQFSGNADRVLQARDIQGDVTF